MRSGLKSIRSYMERRRKEKSKKLKDGNMRLKVEMEGSSFNQGHSTTTSLEKPNFTEISNSRFYNGNSTLNATDPKRKFNNTPSATQRGKSKLMTVWITQGS
jgi:hypothetical protein